MCGQCDKNENLPKMEGERVLAISEVNPKEHVIRIFGTGVYEGQHVPHWVDLDLLISTLPQEVSEAAAEVVAAMMEKFSDPEAAMRISNTSLGMGMSPDRVAKTLDEFLADKKKYEGLTVEEAVKVYIRESVAKEMQSPRIRLDSGEFVYGTHAIFGKEKEMKDALDETTAELAKKGILIQVETVPAPEHADA